MTKNRSHSSRTVLAAVLGTAVLAACGGGGEPSGAPGATASGVALSDAPIAGGAITLADSSSPVRRRTATTAADGSFSLDVSGLSAPYVLEVAWSAASGPRRLQAIAEGADDLDVTPITALASAHAAGGAGEEALLAATAAQKRAAALRARALLTDVTAELAPLLNEYGITSLAADRLRVRRLLQDVTVQQAGGTVTVANRRTGGRIHTFRLPDGSFDPGQLPTSFGPGSFDPGHLPTGLVPGVFDPSQLPTTFDPGSFDPSQVASLFDPGRWLDPSHLPSIFDPGRWFDPSHLPTIIDPGCWDPGQLPSMFGPGGRFDPSQLPSILGPGFFDPSHLPTVFGPGTWDPSHLPSIFDPGRWFDPSQIPSNLGPGGCFDVRQITGVVTPPSGAPGIFGSSWSASVAALYGAACASCHGALPSSEHRNVTARQVLSRHGNLVRASGAAALAAALSDGNACSGSSWHDLLPGGSSGGPRPPDRGLPATHPAIPAGARCSQCH